MRVLAVLRVLFCAIALGFFADMLRRCFVVQAWTLVPFVSALLALALIATRRSWRAARRAWLPTKPTPPAAPVSSDFPEQPRRGIR